MIYLAYILIVIGLINTGSSLIGLQRTYKTFKGSKDSYIFNDVLLGPEDLQRHSKELAKHHSFYNDRTLGIDLLGRMNLNFDVLTDIYKKLNKEVMEKKLTPPASEWLLDNYYIIEQQVKEIKLVYSSSFQRGLKILDNGHLKGFPRVYALAWELVSHSDGNLNEEAIESFIESYQQINMLSISELWAIPIMLRMVLIENIRVLSEKTMEAQREWNKVGDIAGKTIDEVLAIIVKEGKSKTISPSFIECLMRRIRKEGLESKDIIVKLNSLLENQNSNIESLIQWEHQIQASRKISMGNSITSLNVINSLDWQMIFEKLSKVEEILKGDPTKTYEKMDYESRNYYRNVVESIAKKCRTSETSVAKKAVELAASNNIENGSRGHVGYYLIDKGKEQLICRYRETDLKRLISKTKLYIGPIILMTLLGVALTAFKVASLENINISLIVLISLVSILPWSEISITLMNWLVTMVVPTSFLAKMDFEKGVPNDSKTLVVITALLTESGKVEEYVSKLETYYLGNRDKNIFFGLVCDFKDSLAAQGDRDIQIQKKLTEAFNSLSKKYSTDQERFYFFVRERTFNKNSNRYMGWERKRGAIIELNDLIRGSNGTNFKYVKGNIDILIDIKYVITLDSDTILPIDGAKKLIGTLAHPLNRAVVDYNKGVVKSGYGIIQPRIGVTIGASSRTFFSRLFAGQGGIDPYTTAVSDVYMDIFKEGIFTGKGIYDLDVFNMFLKEAIPENRVLSHDLLEGSYLRTALAVDIELFDDYPSTYLSYMTRLHRWVRGDWQLLPWLFKYVSNSRGSKIKNPLSALSKWKILDNLRRSLINLSLLLLFFAVIILSDLLLPYVILLIIMTLGLPILLGQISSLLMDKMTVPYGKYETLSKDSASGLKMLLINIAFLPFNSLLQLDAIIRTLYRLTISKKHLLEWTTAAEVDRNNIKDVSRYYRAMYHGPLIAFLTLAVGWYFGVYITYYLPFIFLWFISPSIAFNISQSRKERVAKELLSMEDSLYFRGISRKIWNYYDEFSREANNYLPPDNFQEDPPNGVDKRTSPTNIGFLLASYLTARDFGYITTTHLLHRISGTINTLEKLDKWHGHLYNWYGTDSLSVLYPKYISTVDSGNLIGILFALKEGLKEYLKQPLISSDLLRGLLDTITLAIIENQGKGKVPGEKDDIVKDLKVNIKEIIEDKINKGNITIKNWSNFLEDIRLKKGGYWEKKYNNMISLFLKEISYLFPHTEVVSNPPVFLNTEKFGELKGILDGLGDTPSLNSLLIIYAEGIREIKNLLDIELAQHEKSYLEFLLDDLATALQSTKAVVDSFEDIISRIDTLIKETDFKPLYNKTRNLFSIGYNVEEERLTNSYYDLLASEARIASYIAICRGEVPKKHWFKLGRSLSISSGHRSLVSWAGTMFEYFMPSLLMKTYPFTLLDETLTSAVEAQMAYGKKRNVPWGTSESGYYAFDLRLNYQYQAFGVPELGLKRGLINDMVVSPYSTFLALVKKPKEGLDNLKTLKEHGLEGKYGFYEAVDYTPERLSNVQKMGIVRSYMAHHQGMSLVALNNILNDDVMVKRFHKDPIIKCGELLLQERVPKRAIITKESKDVITPLAKLKRDKIEVIRSFTLNNSALPKCHILTNGRYHVLLTDGGTGYSRGGNIQVSRYREDSLLRQYGTFIFIKNLNSGEAWSVSSEPIKKKPDSYKATFYQDKARYVRIDNNIETVTEVVVSTEDDGEIRRVKIINHGDGPVNLEVTSYLETVLTNQNADLAHPTFSNLFVRTEFEESYNTLLASRRPRGEKEKIIWALHTILIEGQSIGRLQYETDRSKFIGRSHNITNPVALENPLSNTTGAVLDPIFSLRGQIRIEPEASATVTFVTALSQTRDEALTIAEKYHSSQSIMRAYELAYTRSQVEMSYLNQKPEEIKLYFDLIPHILYMSPLRKNYEWAIKGNRLGQSSLWKYGISGDLPILLINIASTNEIDIVLEGLKAHDFMRAKGITLDLVILFEEELGYYTPIHDLLREVTTISYHHLIDKPGGIFIRGVNDIKEEDKILLFAVSRLVLKGGQPIQSQLLDAKFDYLDVKNKLLCPSNVTYINNDPPLETTFNNGYGGFSMDGSEYVIRLTEGKNTPAPWINVISNNKFGFIVTELGSGYTWAENSRENRLTPWSNDPVSDPPGEAYYIRDEETGEFWSITPLPIREKNSYTIRHGMGYSVFSHSSHGIEQEMTVFADKDKPVKINIIKLKNRTSIVRNLTITGYIRPVLGVLEQSTQLHIITEGQGNKILIRNPYNTEFPGGTIVFASTIEPVSFTGDRTEFIGPNGTLSNPQGMGKEALRNNLGAGLDPCGVLQVPIKLEPLASTEVAFTLSYTVNGQEREEINTFYQDLDNTKKSLMDVKDYWRELLGTIKVHTPDPSMDILLNGWLLYQTIACRIWGRSAFYQSGGAYGFRDQLQDAMNVIHVAPEVTKNQILLHSAHQYIEGDVQHWWHPGGGNKGIRTRFSDDLLWLPFATSLYVSKTKDYSILDIVVPFLEEDPLMEHQDERYGIPVISTEASSVYDHCLRAIDRSLRFGANGIPLMGSGDWNDGMNTVGNKGKGESIWLGWFLYSILMDFIPICKDKGDYELAEKYNSAAQGIIHSIEKNGWDGEWYRRAYFDNGIPLGSSENQECIIDSLAQTWSVISRGSDEKRRILAMNGVEKHLIKRDMGIILLFTPPFDKSDLEPGYIKSYVPGVRENGGQYTHAAIWVINAYAMLGDGDKAWELFNMINPINHSRTNFESKTYKVEPYVMAADVYAVHPNVGRGGWTWYTGASGWMYRIALEYILGIDIKGDILLINPCIPRDWNEYKVQYRFKNTLYNIVIKNPDRVNTGVKSVLLDGSIQSKNTVTLLDDGNGHNVEVIMGD